MKRAVAVLLFIVCGAFGAWATLVPTAMLTLDNGQPQDFFGIETWDYTLTVTNGDLSDITSFTIDNVGGIFTSFFDPTGAVAPTGWTASLSDNDITFTNRGSAWGKRGRTVSSSCRPSLLRTQAPTPTF
jgi:hypothetical protein